MADLYYENQYFTTQLSVSGGISDTQTTSIVIQSVTGIDDTSKPGIALINYADPLDTDVAEWITYTSINSTTKTFQGVTRGAEGFSAKTHDNAVTVAFPHSKSHINNINDKLTGNDTGVILDTPTINNNILGTFNGWIGADETWTYSAWDDTNGVSTATITVPSDATTKYSAGMRVMFDQTTDGTKYGIITAVASTSLTVFMNTDYDFDNETISNPFYSPFKAPFGFDLDPDKYMVELTDSTQRSQSSPSAGTWYNLGSLSIDIPIGSWNTSYQVYLYSGGSSSSDIHASSTLSTANNSESDSEWTANIRNSGTSATRRIASLVSRSKTINLSTKDTYYLNAELVEGTASNVQFENQSAPLVIRAICAYL